jgi:hypothetical protein
VRSDAGIAGALSGLRIPGAGKHSFDIERYNTVNMHTCTWTKISVKGLWICVCASYLCCWNDCLGASALFPSLLLCVCLCVCVCVCVFVCVQCRFSEHSLMCVCVCMRERESLCESFFACAYSVCSVCHTWGPQRSTSGSCQCTGDEYSSILVNIYCLSMHTDTHARTHVDALRSFTNARDDTDGIYVCACISTWTSHPARIAQVWYHDTASFVSCLQRTHIEEECEDTNIAVCHRQHRLVLASLASNWVRLMRVLRNLNHYSHMRLRRALGRNKKYD